METKNIDSVLTAREQKIWRRGGIVVAVVAFEMWRIKNSKRIVLGLGIHWRPGALDGEPQHECYLPEDRGL